MAHALAITVSSLSIVVVSIYYGFFVKYEKNTTVNLILRSREGET